MSNFDSFFQGGPSEEVIGTYLYPYILLDEPDYSDTYSATLIISKLFVNDLEIYISLNGGLFVIPPIGLVELTDKLKFEERVADAFNLLICEFAFKGIVSVPATPVHISVGKLIDNHALIISATGGREIYLEKTIEQAMHLTRGTWRSHKRCNPKIIEEVMKLNCSSKLVNISEYLPSLIAGAYSFFSQRQLSEALIDSWIVIEQIIDYYWSDYVSSITDAQRKNRLIDTRTYSASVRIEFLYSASVFPHSLYVSLNIARKHRNDLAHRAHIESIMAIETVDAFKQFIEFYCDCTINPLLFSESVNW